MGAAQKFYIKEFTGKSVKDIFNFFKNDPMPKLDSSMAFVHVGNPIVLEGELPVVYTGAKWPQEFFSGLDAGDLPPISTMGQQWWQHYTPTYAKLIHH
jgi:hypothetical protein